MILVHRPQVAMGLLYSVQQEELMVVQLSGLNS